MASELRVFSGRSNLPLAEKIADALDRLLGKVAFHDFQDGEIWVKYEENIRGHDVFIIQTTSAPERNLFELLMMIDAARRASANRITAVIPYFGYARQDRKDQPRVSVTAKLVANLIVTAGASRVLTMDLHAPQIQGFFDIPLDHLYSAPVFAEYFKKKNISDLVLVSPDIGSMTMTRAYAKRLSAPLALIDKRRPEPNKCEVVNLVGKVEGKNVLMIDDIVDTAGTLVGAAQALKEAGAKDIFVAATHALFSGDAVRKIVDSPIKKFIVTDTLMLPKVKRFDGLEELTVSKIFAKAIAYTYNNESISSLFDVPKDEIHLE